MQIKLGHGLAVAFATALLSLGAVSVQAFTLIAIAAVTVKPTQGFPTAAFVVDGTYKTSVCSATPPAFTFYFYWDKATPSQQIWKPITVTTCNVTNQTYDTGPSPKLVPLPGQANPAVHHILLAVFTAAGAPAPGNSTATANYTVVTPPPPSPSPRPSPRPSPTPTHRPIPTPTHRASPIPKPSLPPSPSACAAPTASVGPGGPSGPSGSDVAVMLALVVLGAIPVGGLALLFSPTFPRRLRELSGVAAILGLTVITMISVNACTLRNQTAQTTPSQAAASPSPSPTPTC
jgi:hypothetical protein